MSMYTEAKWGSPQFGTAGGEVTWSFAATIDTYYQFDYRISEPQFQDAIRRAFDTWEAVADIDFIEIADSASNDIRLGWDAIDGPSGTLGEAQYFFYPADGSYSYGTYTTAEVRFDTSEYWSLDGYAYGTDFYAVALHEIGHTIGLAHNDDPSTIMYPYKNQQKTLSSVDIDAIQALYGPSDHEPNVFHGTAGDDFLDGTNADEIFLAGDGDDVIYGRGGDDHIDGGAGIDTAFYSLSRNVYDVVVDANGSAIVEDRGSSYAEGRDTLVNVERLDFVDGTLALDIDGNAGQAYRLYQSAFDRTPDDEGLRFWIGELDNGRSLHDTAAAFVHSHEFEALYGAAPSNNVLVSQFYQNILGREADPEGFAFYRDELDSGRRDVATVLADLSESDENVSRVAPVIDDGIWYA